MISKYYPIPTRRKRKKYHMEAKDTVKYASPECLGSLTKMLATSASIKVYVLAQKMYDNIKIMKGRKK